jgi:hypothetical protein
VFQKTLADYNSAIGDVENAQKSRKEAERLSQGLVQNPEIEVQNNSQKKTNR